MTTELENTAAQAPAGGSTPSVPPAPPRRKTGQGKKKTVKRIVAIAVTLAVIAGIVFGMWFLVFREDDSQGEIYFEYAFRGSIQSTVQGSGNASAREAATITVPANGTVQEVLVSTGDMVFEGQPLFSVYSPAAQNVLTDAEAGVTRAEEALTQAKKQVSDVYAKMPDLTLKAPFAGKLLDVPETVLSLRPGDMVGAGTTVGTLVNDRRLKVSLFFSYAYDGMIQPGQYAAVSVPAVMLTTAGRVDKVNRVNYISPEGGSYFEAVISFDNPGTLTTGMAATASLTAPDGSPIYPYDGGKTEYYESRLLTTKESGPLIRSVLLNYADVWAGQALLSVGSETLNDQLAAAQAGVSSAETALAAAQEAVTKAREDLAALDAVAPIDGTVVSSMLFEGAEVKAGDAVLTVSNTARMVVNITVDDRNIGFVKLGDMIQLSDWNGSSYMGTVTNVAAQGEVGQGMSSFPVTLEVDNYDGSLYAGAWLDYSFVTSQSEDCVLVPTTAVKNVIDTNGDAHTVVFVHREEPPEEYVELDPGITKVPRPSDGYYPVPVETGIADTRSVEIKSGIEDGDQVFINFVVTDFSDSYN